MRCEWKLKFGAGFFFFFVLLLLLFNNLFGRSSAAAQNALPQRAQTLLALPPLDFAG